jgi:hypothetical protein
MQHSAVSKYMSFSAVASGVLLYCLGSPAAVAAGTDPHARALYAFCLRQGLQWLFAAGFLVGRKCAGRLWKRRAKDASDGKFSTIVQYSLTGKVKSSFRVRGHNDGLRLIGENDLWAMQNEDANPNLVVINLKTWARKEYTFPHPVHGGGYDDIAVQGGRVFISASNPNLNPKGVNVFPALLEVARLAGGFGASRDRSKRGMLARRTSQQATLFHST